MVGTERFHCHNRLIPRLVSHHRSEMILTDLKQNGHAITTFHAYFNFELTSVHDR